MSEEFVRWLIGIIMACTCAAPGAIPAANTAPPAAIATVAPESTTQVVVPVATSSATQATAAPIGSGCIYRTGFVFTVPSGAWGEAGVAVTGPAWAVPVRGNPGQEIAVFSKKRPVLEGSSYTPAAREVVILYETGTGCDLTIEDNWTPDLP